MNLLVSETIDKHISSKIKAPAINSVHKLSTKLSKHELFGKLHAFKVYQVNVHIQDNVRVNEND